MVKLNLNKDRGSPLFKRNIDVNEDETEDECCCCCCCSLSDLLLRIVVVVADVEVVFDVVRMKHSMMRKKSNGATLSA